MISVCKESSRTEVFNAATTPQRRGAEDSESSSRASFPPPRPSVRVHPCSPWIVSEIQAGMWQQRLKQHLLSVICFYCKSSVPLLWACNVLKMQSWWNTVHERKLSGLKIYGRKQNAMKTRQQTLCGSGWQLSPCLSVNGHVAAREKEQTRRSKRPSPLNWKRCTLWEG